jgi:hypothetical protein
MVMSLWLTAAGSAAKSAEHRLNLSLSDWSYRQIDANMIGNELLLTAHLGRMQNTPPAKGDWQAKTHRLLQNINGKQVNLVDFRIPVLIAEESLECGRCHATPQLLGHTNPQIEVGVGHPNVRHASACRRVTPAMSAVPDSVFRILTTSQSMSDIWLTSLS